MKNIALFNLRWFDGEGTAPGASENADADSMTTGVGTREDDTQNILYGRQPEPEAAAQEQEEEPQGEANPASYNDFKRQFQKEYQEDLRRIINKRFKKATMVESERDALKSQNEQYDELMKVLSQRFGTNDVEQLTRQLADDKEWREEQALKQGLSLEAYDRVQEAEKKADKATSELEQLSNQKIIEDWENEAAQLVQLYPSFSFAKEIENEKFALGLQSGMSVRDAYQFAHFDEIISGAIEYTARETKRAVAQAKAQRMARPAENGTKAVAAATVKSDVSKLSKKDMEEIDKRVLRGERISFS